MIKLFYCFLLGYFLGYIISVSPLPVLINAFGILCNRYLSAGIKPCLLKTVAKYITQPLKILWGIVSGVYMMTAINFKSNPWRHIVQGLITTACMLKVN